LSVAGWGAGTRGSPIGDGTLIGMGRIVTGDIPPGVIAYGNPCKVVRDNDVWKD